MQSSQDNKNSRASDLLGKKLANGVHPDLPLILTSPSDIGVQRNWGRNGARFAPKAIINCLKKMNDHLPYESIGIKQVSDQQKEILNYDLAQQESAKEIGKCLSASPRKIVHLGGGHDHALPMLNAIEKDSSIKNILVVNFDAHCDTRVDEIKHSGTPFRDFDQISQKPFHLVQVGIHEFANNKKTLSPLKNHTERIIYRSELQVLEERDHFIDAILADCPFDISKSVALFISLDCDALDASVMSAVSAVNHWGLKTDKLWGWLKALKALPTQLQVFGIYEYNPLYDDLSQKGARLLSALIYDHLND